MKVFARVLICLLLCLYSVSALAATEGNYEYSVVNNEAVINKCYENAANLVVPNTLGGYAVTSIGDYAFNWCSNLVSVDLPDWINSIGTSAFDGCKKLVSVDIPSSVKKIGSKAFQHCESLASIEIPEEIESIGEAALLGCKSLKTVKIPDTITSIEKYLFMGCSGLTSVSIPDSVTSIGEWAFWGCSALPSISIPENVTNIGKWAFYACNGLVSIDIPAGVKSIGDSTFSNCRNLVSVNLPQGLQIIDDTAFNNCESLSMICLPDSVTNIGMSAFDGCAFRSLTIPSSVTSILDSIADDCEYMTSVVLPKELTEIGWDAFPESVTTVYCYRGSAAETWAKKTGRIPVYLDTYDIEKAAVLAGPSDDVNYSFLFETGKPYAWKKDYYVAPLALGKIYSLQCTSSDPSVAKVEDEYITFIKSGKVSLTVTVEGMPQLSHTREIEVYDPVESFTFPETVFVHIHEDWNDCPVIPVENIAPQTANPYFVYESAEMEYWGIERQREVEIIPESSIGVENARVHSVGAYGSGEYPSWDTEPYAQFKIVTYDKVNSIEALGPDKTLETGEVYWPDITVTVDNMPFINETMTYTLKSSAPDIIRTKEDGSLEAVAPGVATITATSFAGNNTATFSITVVRSKTLRLPAGTMCIKDEAFRGTDACAAIIPDGCESIGSHAFADCANLVRVEIPASVTEIAVDAFAGCGDFEIIAPEGSYAAEFAQMYHLAK